MRDETRSVFGVRWLRQRVLGFVLCLVGVVAGGVEAVPRGGMNVPSVLKDWQGWVLAGRPSGPSPYNDGAKVEPLWWDGCGVNAEGTHAAFVLKVHVFDEAWLRLPGGAANWPEGVLVDGVGAVVVEHDGWPSVRLKPKPADAVLHRVEGRIPYGVMPQKLAIPSDVGLLELVVSGERVDIPVWEGADHVWLRRTAVEKTVGTDSLSVQVTRLVEDGQPVWLRTQVDLSVGGRSREEVLGTLIPEGWKLSRLESRIPVAVDGAGRMKAQVRPGKWTVVADAFRADDVKELRFSADAKPLVAREVIGLKGKPDFRVVELEGVEAVDPAQVKYPDGWKGVSLFQWETARAVGLVQRLRGAAGGTDPGVGAGLTVQRSLWLDDDGRAFTFRDRLTGSVRGEWRLDVSSDVELGAVSQADAPLLVTRNPVNGATGVELRDRALSLDARGRVRVPEDGVVSASGWLRDAERVSVELMLPPGWRLFGLFGADSVKGDWLSAWSLLDLFLLLLFGLSVGRMFGWAGGMLALVTLGLTYHEPGAPRYLWFMVLIPIALSRVVRGRVATTSIASLKWVAVIGLGFVVVPFIYLQVQSVMYPQLETIPNGLSRAHGLAVDAPTSLALGSAAPLAKAADNQARRVVRDNLAQDVGAQIQTGPAVPEWNWRKVTFGWNSPVSPKDRVRLLLIPGWLGRGLGVLRVLLVAGVLGLLLRRRERASGEGDAGSGVTGHASVPAGVAVALGVGLWMMVAGDAMAQTAFPPAELLKELQERSSRLDDAFPHAADVTRARLQIRGNRMVLEAEVHAAARCAVPLPGKVASGTPLSLKVDGNGAVSGRRDGYLWVVLDAGVHQVRVESMLAERGDWQWTYLLRPRRMEVDAPEWEVGGLRAGGGLEEQLFFSLKARPTERTSEYERQELAAVLRVERTVELGLAWQVRTTVRRLSPVGSGVQALVPLVDGERVLTSGVVVRDGAVEVRLGARDETFVWESVFPVREGFRLVAGTGGWVETWKLEVSPVWNVEFKGLAPVFGGTLMQPEWSPWPGEAVEIAVKRPDSVPGQVVTVNRLRHQIQPGMRHRDLLIDAEIRSTLGGDFMVTLPAGAEGVQVKVGGKGVPARVREGRVAVPLQPGVQAVEIRWSVAEAQTRVTSVDNVSFPVELANVKIEAGVPESRWVLWAWGPLRGPAVRFWSLAASCVIGALVLRRFGSVPLGMWSWLLLLVGLTQAPLVGAGLAVLWFFVIDWRGGVSERDWFRRRAVRYPVQVALVGFTAIFVGVLVLAVSEGLTGRPEMRILGNDSTRVLLKWFEARASAALPDAGYLSVSIWWYRLMMLLWALWLASSAIRWFVWGWRQFSKMPLAGGEAEAATESGASGASAPPPLPRNDEV